ncbi:hypothetical protein [Flavobacterium sp. U410]
MRKIIVLFVLFLVSCEVENYNYIVPVVETYEPGSVQINSASLGGIVLSEGGKDVTEYGLVISTNSNPTVNDIKIEVGSRLGEFYTIYTGLESSTKYYYTVYAINEIGVGYGKVYEFTTGTDIPCQPSTDNYVNLTTSQININNVDVTYPSYSFGEGNLQFETLTYSSTARIKVNFDEIGRNYPLTGEYTVTNSSDFGSNINLSQGYAKLSINDWGYGGYGGAIASPGTKFYVENNGETMSIIFCNTPVGTQYVLNGKFTLNVPD